MKSPVSMPCKLSSGYVETDSGKVVRVTKSTCKRNGTLNLFAALEIPADRCMPKPRNKRSAKTPGVSWIKSWPNCLPIKTFTSFWTNIQRNL